MSNLEEFTVRWGIHQDRVAQLGERKLPISEAIRELVQLYAESFETTPYTINQGMCDQFAEDVRELIEGAEAHWGDELTNEDDNQEQFGYHCIVHYEGRYYDSEHPDGVSDFRQISAFWPPANPFG